MARTSCGESPPTPWICASQRATILRRVCILRDEQKIVHVEVCPRTSSGACGLDQQKIDSQQPTTLQRDSTVWWRRKSPNGEVSPKHFIFASSECRLEQSTRHNAWPKVRIIIKTFSVKNCVDVHFIVYEQTGQKKKADSTGNRTRVCTVAGYYSTTRPSSLFLRLIAHINFL